MVAENSTTWRFSGSWLSTHSTSSMKPMRNISSASSSTKVRRPERSRVPWRMWSITRPGVPTTIWTPRLSRAIWSRKSAPPYTGSTRRWGILAAKVLKASATWIASSRVGASTSTWGVRWLGSIAVSRGRAKAAVLPVPVWAWPTRSRPSRSSGMAAFWIGEGSW